MLGPRLLLLAVLGMLASSAHAGVIGVRTIIPAFSGVDAALTAHTGIVLNLMTDDGSFITAIDVTISGTLHQRWTVDPDIPETTPTPVGVSLTNGDSHLTAPASALFVVTPEEDNTGAGSPLPDTATRDYGYGTTLHAVWGILGGNQSTAASVAYVVVPHGTENSLSITGQVATTAGSYPMPNFMLPIEQHSHASPALGSELNFGQFIRGASPSDQQISLTLGQRERFRVTGYELTGPDADKFLVRGLPSVTLDLDTPSNTWSIGWNSPAARPGIYEAQVLFRTDAGVFPYTLSAVVVAEPNGWLFASILLGANCMLRRK